jgi:uncharacterized protein (TIGR02996 family)
MRLEFKEGKSSKFWEIEQDGKKLVTRWGRIGTDGQEKKESLANEWQAKSSLQKQVAAKIAKGYAVAPDAKTLAAQAKVKSAKRNPQLEALIAKSPDDPDGYLVYADWLAGEGDPRGELITLQHQISELSPKDVKGARGKALAKREAQILKANDHFLGGLHDPEILTVKWRWGFVESVRFMNSKDWMDSSFQILPIARTFFALPIAIAVREIKVGVLRWEYQSKDLPALIDAIGKLGAGKMVKTLRLGDCDDIDIDCAHHQLGSLKEISKTFPNLETFTLFGSDFTLGPLALPKLRELEIKSCSLKRADVEALGAAKLPALERMSLWFGSADYGGMSTLKGLDGILDGSGMPKLRHLGLMNAEFTNDLCDALANAKVTKKLESLDLGKGTLDKRGVESLVANARAFAKLATLDVSDNFLSKDDLKALAKIKGPKIVSTEQKDIEEDDGEAFRYVSMSE